MELAQAGSYTASWVGFAQVRFAELGTWFGTRQRINGRAHRFTRRNRYDRGCSVDGVRDIVASKQEASAVAQRRDERTVAVE